MTTQLVDVVLPCRSFGLDWWLDGPQRIVELETAATANDHVEMLLWVPTDWAEEFRVVAEDESHTKAVNRLSTIGDRTLFEIELLREPDLVPAMIAAVDGDMISSYGNNDGWYSRCQFPDESALVSFENRCVTAGLDPYFHTYWWAAEQEPV